MGIFINTDLSAGGPGADQRASPNDEVPNRVAPLGNYIKSLGAFADTPLPQILSVLYAYSYKCCHTIRLTGHLHSSVLLFVTVIVAVFFCWTTCALSLSQLVLTAGASSV